MGGGRSERERQRGAFDELTFSSMLVSFNRHLELTREVARRSQPALLRCRSQKRTTKDRLGGGSMPFAGYPASCGTRTNRLSGRMRRSRRRLSEQGGHGACRLLGGGFGGVATARHLERALRRHTGVEITLVSRENFFVITPLLFEACSGRLELRHCAQPIRAALRRARFVEATVEGVDVERQIVRAVAAEGAGTTYRTTISSWRSARPRTSS